ncbi:DMT family transporter [Moraxellaceae bacterium AER2_44_116]|nr:DMT family transporter [Moraxellaceae bacterium]TQC97403.1 DMT family transporter [Moraxellaceae bacterium AER2_44_116]
MPQQSLIKGLALLSLSALLFATMGVLIRLASHTVDNATVVFMRNLTGTLLLTPFVLSQGKDFLVTHKPWMHLWRALVGLAAMYGFFYAIAHLPLSNAMVFTYSSPVFIPLVAWLFLKEKITPLMLLAAFVGLIGVGLVAKPDVGMFNWLSLVGISSSFLAAMAFVTVRALAATEPATRTVFYFCLIATFVSAIPMCWHWRILTLQELYYLVGAGTLATISQISLSKAYAYAPAGKIGPANYLAIIFAGMWAWVLWDERPDVLAIIGMLLIFVALMLCLPKKA